MDRRLNTLDMRRRDIHVKNRKRTEYNVWYISKLAAKYLAGGIDAIAVKHYEGNHRSMSYEEEDELLAQLIKEAKDGHIKMCQ